jgi:hypothetical protein
VGARIPFPSGIRIKKLASSFGTTIALSGMSSFVVLHFQIQKSYSEFSSLTSFLFAFVCTLNSKTKLRNSYQFVYFFNFQ